MAIGTNVVDSGNPASIHGGLFLPRILVLVSFDLHSKMEQIIITIAVINKHDKVWPMAVHLRAVAERFTSGSSTR